MRTIEDMNEEIARLDGMLGYLTARKHELLLKVQRRQRDEARIAERAKAKDPIERQLKAVTK